MKNSKALLSAIALASAAFVSSGAYAADASHPTEALDIVDNAAFFGALFPGNSAGDTFSDKYTFTLSTMGSLTADVLSISSKATNGLDITGFNLWDANGVIQAGSMLSTGTADSWTLSANNLAAGNYTLQIAGSVVGQPAGKYYANIALAPVPEPETYAMMLAGLGMLGVVARRRKQKAEQAA